MRGSRSTRVRRWSRSSSTRLTLPSVSSRSWLYRSVFSFISAFKRIGDELGDGGSAGGTARIPSRKVRAHRLSGYRIVQRAAHDVGGHLSIVEKKRTILLTQRWDSVPLALLYVCAAQVGKEHEQRRDAEIPPLHRHGGELGDHEVGSAAETRHIGIRGDVDDMGGGAQQARVPASYIFGVSRMGTEQQEGFRLSQGRQNRL